MFDNLGTKLNLPGYFIFYPLPRHKKAFSVLYRFLFVALVQYG